MGAEGHDPRTLFVQVSIDLHERQATPGEVAHTRHKPTILLARLAWQRLELGLGVVHGLELVVLHAARPRVEPPPPRGLVRVRVFLPEGISTVLPRVRALSAARHPELCRAVREHACYINTRSPNEVEQKLLKVLCITARGDDGGVLFPRPQHAGVAISQVEIRRPGKRETR